METCRTEILKVEDLSKSFGKLSVLKDVSFSIYDGEMVCLLGPSGCGKTTLLRMLAGLLPFDRGGVSINGKDIHNKQLYHQDVSMVFQEPRLLPWRNAANNVALPFELSETPLNYEAKQAVASALELVGLVDFSTSFPHELSGGMRQRVALARALATNPRILLMDEPLTGLDVRTRGELQDEIIRIWSQKKMSLLWVTHDPQEAIYLADRIIVLSGRPGNVKAILPISLARPRQRMSPDMLNLEKDIRALFE
jgi:ABC-type nitrate/sulfonate/bicarbonate transport system ATPase subunit